MTLIRILLSIVAVEDLHLEQLDVRTTFLHGDLDEELYMVQSKGFEVKCKKHMVCRLNKSLYCLKQASWQLYLKFDGKKNDLYTVSLIIMFIFTSMMMMLSYISFYM